MEPWDIYCVKVGVYFHPSSLDSLLVLSLCFHSIARKSRVSPQYYSKEDGFSPFHSNSHWWARAALYIFPSTTRCLHSMRPGKSSFFSLLPFLSPLKTCWLLCLLDSQQTYHPYYLIKPSVFVELKKFFTLTHLRIRALSAYLDDCPSNRSSFASFHIRTSEFQKETTTYLTWNLPL